MNYIINDIVWWKISILGFVNGWLPGILTFLLGVILEKIASNLKMKHNLKQSLLGIFIPTFNTGRKISKEQAERAILEFRVTLNTYRQIYPKIFKKQPAEQLETIFNQELFNQEGKVTDEFNNPQIIIRLIKLL